MASFRIGEIDIIIGARVGGSGHHHSQYAPFAARFAVGNSSLETDGVPAHIAAVEMSTLEVRIPDLLLKQVNEVAAKEKISVDQIVAIALAAQVSASQARESISSRAKRVDWQKVDDILARVPASPALPGDEVP
jgi:hypothetical protein